jgi:hypothetical protein
MKIMNEWIQMKPENRTTFNETEKRLEVRNGNEKYFNLLLLLFI